VVLKDNAPCSKKDLTCFLGKKRIDTRPIIAGNIVAQPFLKDFNFRNGCLVNSDLVMRNGFFLGIHHNMGKKQVKYMVDSLREFFSKR